MTGYVGIGVHPCLSPDINVHFPLLVGGVSHLKLYNWRTKSARTIRERCLWLVNLPPRKSTAPPQKYKALLRAY